MSHFTGRGIAYERPVSFEILDAQAGLNCQVVCGIRIAGSNYHRDRYSIGDNWHGRAYNGNKIGLKLYFRSIYGDKELDYPAFPIADAEQFQRMILRSGWNDMHDPFINDEWFRRLNKDMGGVASTGTIVNFFLNGQFKSYFNPCEWLDEDFFQDYYDVDTEWDVITHNGARDGDTVAWDTAVGFFSSNDLSDPDNYIQAKEIVDVVNLIDYLIIQLYSTNKDWVTSSYVNNWTASRERSSEGKWRFHCWDMEFITGNVHSNLIPNFHSKNYGFPLMFRKLQDSPEFRLLFADRIQKHFFYDGALTKANLRKRYAELQRQMSQVLSNMSTSILDHFIPNRQKNLLDMFTSEGLFPGQGPDFQVNGVSQHGGYVLAGDALAMSDPCDTGTIYYTLDGSEGSYSSWQWNHQCTS